MQRSTLRLVALALVLIAPAAAAQESLENGDKMHSKGALQRMLEFFGETSNQ